VSADRQHSVRSCQHTAARRWGCLARVAHKSKHNPDSTAIQLLSFSYSYSRCQHSTARGCVCLGPGAHQVNQSPCSLYPNRRCQHTAVRDCRSLVGYETPMGGEQGVARARIQLAWPAVSSQCSTVQHSTVQHSTALTVQYSTVQYTSVAAQGCS
jgi:hypothetical protein